MSKFIRFRISEEELAVIEQHPEFDGSPHALVRLLAFRELGLPAPTPEQVAETRRRSLAEARKYRHPKNP